MIARGFKSVIWVGAVGSAALACYMVSLRVATERAELTRVEAQIIAAKRDIRSLQTELGTRGRMSQLEQWNAEVLALSAPTSAQFLPDQVTLARFDQPETTLEERSAQVRMASAEAAPESPASAAPSAPVVQAAMPQSAPARPLVRQASFTPDAPKAVAAVAPAAKKADAPAKPKVQQAKAEKPAAPSEAKKADAKKADAKKLVEAAKLAAPKKPEAKTAAKATADKPAAKPAPKVAGADAKTTTRKPQGSAGN
ncbi:MAG TPA: hypothetical protein VGC35_12160 [Allosphingosinicella sp.]|jgi:hypothetical protein